MFLRRFFKLAALGACAPLLVACHRCGTPEKRAQWITDKIASKLELTDAQRPKLDAIKEQVLVLRKEMHEKRAAGFDDLVKLVQAESLDKAKLNALLTERTTTVQKQASGIIDKVAELHATLDAKQKARVVEALEKFRSHWE